LLYVISSSISCI